MTSACASGTCSGKSQEPRLQGKWFQCVPLRMDFPNSTVFKLNWKTKLTSKNNRGWGTLDSGNALSSKHIHKVGSPSKNESWVDVTRSGRNVKCLTRDVSHMNTNISFQLHVSSDRGLPCVFRQMKNINQEKRQ